MQFSKRAFPIIILALGAAVSMVLAASNHSAPAGDIIVSKVETSAAIPEKPSDEKGLYRKDYEDVGRLWKEHSEHGTPPPDEPNQTGKPHPDNSGIGVVCHFPGTYEFYSFDYTPGAAYPSIYCYYGIVPPYISGNRVTCIRPEPRVIYTFTDFPSIITNGNCMDDKGYYLYNRPHSSLSSALRDVCRAWERGDIDLMMRHVNSDSAIDVYLKGDYAYSLSARDYREMTSDAMRAIDTISFDFYRVRKRCCQKDTIYFGGYQVDIPNETVAVAYGTHVYYDSWRYWDDRRYVPLYSLSGPRQQHTVYVSYTFEQRGSDWYITEVGCSPFPLY